MYRIAAVSLRGISSAVERESTRTEREGKKSIRVTAYERRTLVSAALRLFRAEDGALAYSVTGVANGCRESESDDQYGKFPFWLLSALFKGPPSHPDAAELHRRLARDLAGSLQRSPANYPE